MHELYELREMLCDELKKYGTKDLTTGSLDVVDKLAHAIKNLDKIIGESEYSGRSYRRERSRYSMADKLRELSHDAPDERTRMEISRLADKMM